MLSSKTIERLKLISSRTREWEDKPELMPKDLREEFAMMVSSTFHDFAEFAEVGMRVLGFSTTEMQLDIARYMADKSYGRKKMVQAQRGEAKSTLAALYAVWCLIQDQSTRVLVVSGGEKQASDVAILIIRIIENWQLLCWLRPDSTRGDRTSFENYDVHCDLKPLDKSASVSCVGITANLQGKRADILIPDDIETSKNSLTQTMRDQLLHLSKDFAAINTHGETLYLGTPQTKDSIYKTLAARGFHIRVWPGRFPNKEELARYPVDALAPSILEALEADPALGTGYGIDGTRGAPSDPQRYDEDALIEKELDFGPEGFSLQFMLDTTLSDALRTRIRCTDLIVGDYTPEAAPEVLWWAGEPRHAIGDLPESCTGLTLYRAASASDQFMPYQHKVMIIDPAGNGGDEVAFSIGGVTNSYIHLMTCGGLKGGMTEQNMTILLEYAMEFGCTDIKVEANMGHGVVSALLTGHAEKLQYKTLGFEDFYAKGQKEKRIIDTISPVTRRHKLVIHRRALEDDWKFSQEHTREKRTVTSFMHQLVNITYDRGSLAYDDRLDTIQALVQFLSGFLIADDEKEAEKRKQVASAEFIKNPMEYNLPKRKNLRERSMAAFWRK